jgi:hypothetical protein
MKNVYAKYKGNEIRSNSIGFYENKWMKNINNHLDKISMAHISTSGEAEKLATSYALEAVRLDKQGNKEQAIVLYQKASEMLLKLSMQHPEYALNKVYLQKAVAYQERIKILRSSTY